MYRVSVELYKHVDEKDIGPDHKLYDLWVHQKDKSIVAGEFKTLAEAVEEMELLAGITITTNRKMENSAGGTD